ncbi:MAG: hypothetical protein WCC90_05050, partial [Methylocella sp.]
RFFRGDEIYVGGREKRARGRETGPQCIVEATAATASTIAVLQPKSEQTPSLRKMALSKRENVPLRPSTENRFAFRVLGVKRMLDACLNIDISKS